MHWAQLYNAKEGQNISSIYGAVTTGDEWKFLQLSQATAYIDIDSYSINNVSKIVGILIAMAQQNI